MKINKPVIRFELADVQLSLPNKTDLKKFLFVRASKEGKSVRELTFVFCTDEYLLGLNLEFLKHDTLTDIITFDLSEDSEEIIGEVYISIDRVRDNASLYGDTFLNELHRVIFHGLLHLLGYGDKNEAEQRNMRLKEEEFLADYLV